MSPNLRIVVIMISNKVDNTKYYLIIPSSYFILKKIITSILSMNTISFGYQTNIEIFINSKPRLYFIERIVKFNHNIYYKNNKNKIFYSDNVCLLVLAP